MLVIRYRHLSLGTQLPPFICQVGFVTQCQAGVQHCEFTLRQDTVGTKLNQLNQPILQANPSPLPCTTYPRLSATPWPHSFEPCETLTRSFLGATFTPARVVSLLLQYSYLPWLLDSVFYAIEPSCPGSLRYIQYLWTLFRCLLEREIANSNLATLDPTYPTVNFHWYLTAI